MNEKEAVAMGIKILNLLHGEGLGHMESVYILTKLIAAFLSDVPLSQEGRDGMPQVIAEQIKKDLEIYRQVKA